MATIVIVNATHCTRHAFVPFAGSDSAFRRVLAFARTLASPNAVHVVALKGFSEAVPDAGLSLVDTGDMRAVLMAALAACPDPDQRHELVYVHGDAPFLDAELSATLLDTHRRYRAEYTYADGYPAGFAPEILSSRALPNLVELASRNDIAAERDGLFALIQKDINSYDIETVLSPVDLRSYRFSPVCDTRRNMDAALALAALGPVSAAGVVRELPERPELLRTLPAFLWVQVTEGCPQACSYCPYPLMVGDPRGRNGFMPLERFESIMAQAEDLCDDLVVDLSLWGEPALHPDFAGLASAVLARKRFTLIVETSGLGWAPGLPESVARAGRERVHWIVSLDDDDDAGYRALRGEGRDEAAAFVQRMAASWPKQTHVQAVRMADTEERLEPFYRHWKGVLDGVIIQKYDSFAACLPKRSVADLEPLERIPCRHLARDLAVLLDGSVPPCKHALARQADGKLAYAATMGNAFAPGGLKAAWDAMGAWYADHAAGRLPPPCEHCDEYHTVNA